jgi:4-oxalocrotonate tautomerase
MGVSTASKESPVPYIEVRVSGDPDTALAGRIAAEATELTARLLGKKPALTAVVVDFVEPSRWFIGGRPLAESGARSYHWSVSITDETNTKAEKAAYLQAVHDSMAALLGGVAEASYTLVAERRGASYGYGGRSQEERAQRLSARSA